MPTPEKPTIAVRVRQGLNDRIEEYATDQNISKSDALRDLLSIGLETATGETDDTATDTDSRVPREYVAYTLGLIAAASAFTSASHTVGYVGLALALGAWVWSNILHTDTDNEGNE